MKTFFYGIMSILSMTGAWFAINENYKASMGSWCVVSIISVLLHAYRDHKGEYNENNF